MPEDDPTGASFDGSSSGPPDQSEATVEGLYADLTDVVEHREEVEEIRRLLAEAHERGILESRVRNLDANDAAEAFVGTVIFATPLLVEDGIYDIADHLFSVTVLGLPFFLLANSLFVVVMTYALLEWTGRNREDTRDLLGIVPTRLLMVLGVSFVVSFVLMTVWGRVGDWQPPTEALARINVIWTVGSLGAALGDVISDSGEPATELPDEPFESDVDGTPGYDSDCETDPLEPLSDTALLEQLHDRFDALGAAVDPDDRDDVEHLRAQTVEAALDDTFGDRIQKYTSRDVAEAVVGSIIFSVPFLVEDGVFDVAAYFLSFQVGFFPVFFLANAAFVIVMIMALVYWAGPQNVQISRPILGIVPRRLIGIAVVSFLTAGVLMTMWGRVGGWADPVDALARISVVWTVASTGAALGDILPGESSGDDINDDLTALGDPWGEDADAP